MVLIISYVQKAQETCIIALLDFRFHPSNIFLIIIRDADDISLFIASQKVVKERFLILIKVQLSTYVKTMEHLHMI